MNDKSLPQFRPPQTRQVVWDQIRTELRNVAEQSPLMVWITEPDGYCIHLNKLWYDYTGQRPQEAEGDGWINALHKADRAMALEAFLSATKRQVPYHVEYRLCRHDAAFHWVVAVGHPFFNPDGTLGGYIGSDSSIDGLVAARQRTEKVLTPREREVLELVSQGKTSSEVAIILEIAARTVEQHIHSAMLKLGATNRVQAAVEATKRGEFIR